MRFLNSSGLDKESGNALVETIVMTVVMVPLFGALPLMGKISDVNNVTVQSSRYLAWERTVSDGGVKTTEDLSTEVNNRFFTKPDSKIKSGQGALTAEEDQNPFWNGLGNNQDDSKNRLFKSGAGIYVEEANVQPSSLAGKLSQGISDVGKAMAKVTKGDWDMEEKGLYTAKVGIDVGGNRLFSGDKNCKNEVNGDTFVCIRRSNTILVDAWEVRDSSHAESRTKTLVPAAGLEEVGDSAAKLVGLVPFFKDLGTLESDDNGGFGYVDSDVVPLERFVEQ